MTTPTGDTTHTDADCLKLFTDTLARLNEINEAQAKGVLNIAIYGAEAARSVSGNSIDADVFIEKVTALIDKMKAESKEGEMGGGAATEHRGKHSGDVLCADVANNINIAMQNSLAAQQQLNVMGMSVLAEAAKLVLDSAGSSQP